MNFNIEIVRVNVVNKGKYSQADVTHKTDEGKIDNKVLVSFGAGKDAFKTLTQATQGDKFAITVEKILNEKDGKEYWTWVGAESLGKGSDPAVAQRVSGQVRSSYETSEERAARQVYIVRQSSISNALDYLVATRTDKKFDVKEVLDIAEQLEEYVFKKNEVKPVEVI